MSTGPRVGVVFPQLDIGPAGVDVRDYATHVEGIGYQHLVTFDHVLGADVEAHPGWNERGVPWSIYDVDSTFHEPLVLFGYLAAVTSLELVTGIMILPQRQTALVAKQAAEVDWLSEGGLRLGVALGWNDVEYEALGKEFDDRGKRIQEQIQLLRLLWTERTVTFKGQWEQVNGAGIAPRPRRSIPIWFGADSAPAFRRVGRLADGWFPQMAPGPKLDEARTLIADAAESIGRDPRSIGMEGRVSMTRGGIEKMVEHVHRWEQAGATHVSINTMYAGLGPISDHMKVLESIADALWR